MRLIWNSKAHALSDRLLKYCVKFLMTEYFQ